MFRDRMKTERPGSTTPDKSRLVALSRVSIPLDAYKEFRYSLIALVVLSAVVASIEGGIHPIILVASIPLLVASLLRKDYSKPFVLPEKVVAGLLLLYVAIVYLSLQAVHGGLSLPVFLVYFAFGTVVARAVCPLTDRNIAQLIFLTLGLILINCILTNHMLFGLLLPVYLFALMATLFLFQLARSRFTPSLLSVGALAEGKPLRWYAAIGKYSLLIVVFTICTFALLPRPFLMIPGFRTAMAAGGGYADLQRRITYRDMASMEGRQRIAFAVKVEQGSLPHTLYWRGRVLDKNDSGGWQPSSEQRAVRHYVPSPKAETVVYRIFPHRLQSNVVYVSGVPLTVLGRMGRMLDINAEGEVSINSPFLYSDSYFVRAVVQPVPAVPGSGTLYLDRAGITPEIEKLAQQWTSGLTQPRDKAAAILAKLRSQFRYKLRTPPPPENVNPIEHFLFETRMGNCEHFAGALCLILRSVGVPARVVEGFAGGEKTADADQLLVRFSMAHAWVEALLNDSAWTTLDATPEIRSESLEEILWTLLADLYYRAEYQWIRQVVHFDRSDQEVLLRKVKELLSSDVSAAWQLSPQVRAAVFAALVGGLFAAILIGYFQIRRTRQEPSSIYLGAMRHLVRAGVLHKVEPWHEQNTARILGSVPAARDALLAFMDLYLRARFNPGETISPEKLRAARHALLERVKKALS